jgi:CBS domain containing-hemolysin-like protein
MRIGSITTRSVGWRCLRSAACHGPETVFERGSYRFEIVDMDGNRVDRLLVSRVGPR